MSNAVAGKKSAWEEKRDVLFAKLARAQRDDEILLGSLAVVRPISNRTHGRRLTDADYKVLQRSGNGVAKLLEQLDAHLLTDPQPEHLLFLSN